MLNQFFIIKKKSEGQIFNSYKYEILNYIENNLPKNTIIEELDNGFFLMTKYYDLQRL